MIRQWETAGMALRFIFMEPPSTLYEDGSQSTVLLDCKLTQVDLDGKLSQVNGVHKWTITTPSIGGQKMKEPSTLSSRRLIQNLPGGGPGVNGTLEDYF
jgi:hypothetical protein